MILKTFVLPILAGWLIAVIINYLADTLPLYRKLSILKCRNCDSSKNLINYFIPLRCHHCGAASLKRHIWVQFVLIISFVLLVYYRPGDCIHTWINWLVTGYLLLIIVIDIEHHLVLHMVSIAGVLLLGFIGTVAHSLLPTLFGGLVGFLVMLGIYIVGYLYSKYKTRKLGVDVEDAVGFGDVTFGGVCGLLMGWPNIIPALVFAIIMGGVWSGLVVLISIFRKKGGVTGSFIAYAPFFAISTGFIWFVLQ